MWAERRDSSDKVAKPLWVQEKLLSVEEELRVTEISAGTVQGSTWGRRRVRAGARAQPHCARGARVSLHRWRRLGWHSRNVPSPHPTSLPCSCSSATPPQPSSAPVFLLPSHLLFSNGPRSPKHSVLIPYFLWKAIFTRKPDILVSKLYSARLMRTRSICEKSLLSKFIIFQTRVYWILPFSPPVPIHCPFPELSV